jgi:hypothetical protein
LFRARIASTEQEWGLTKVSNTAQLVASHIGPSRHASNVTEIAWHFDHPEDPRLNSLEMDAVRTQLFGLRLSSHQLRAARVSAVGHLNRRAAPWPSALRAPPG